MLGLRAGLVALLLAPAAAAAADEPASEPFTPAEYEQAIQRTISGATVRALVGPARTPLPLRVSNFLLDHPDLSAFVVNRRGIAPYRIQMRGPRRSLADDGDGTVGLVNLVERTEQSRLYYGEGVHHSRVFPDIRAAAVIVMRLREEPGPDGRPSTVTTFEVFVRMRSRFVSGVVRALKPFLQKTIVGKFSKAFFVADQVGRAMADDPASVERDVRAYPAMLDDDRASLLDLIARLPRRTPSPAPADRR